MNNRERLLAVLRYQPYDRLPVVHFGFLLRTLTKWADQGHLDKDLARGWADGGPADTAISAALGFDFNYQTMFHPATGLRPLFERKVVRELLDGTQHVLTGDGVVIVQRAGAVGIPGEVEHMLKDRASWQEHYKWRHQWSPDRLNGARVRIGDKMVPFDQGGLEFLRTGQRDYALGLHCGSLYGHLRNILGMEGACYMLADDEPLLDEMIQTIAELCYQGVKAALESGAKFDFAHFWEDICFKNGPLINPKVFAEKVGPHYKRITALLGQYGLDIVSLDCDGCIDTLVPIWLANGVNTMFPIEVGTWGASIAPWRQKYGSALRGVGGMDKNIFARDRQAVDGEIERLHKLVDLGGYLPCPDHRIADDAKWDNVRYYCDRMRQVFG